MQHTTGTPMTTVFMEHLSSAEHVVRFDNQPERILKDVSLKMAAGEAWSVSAPSILKSDCCLRLWPTSARTRRGGASSWSAA